MAARKSLEADHQAASSRATTVRLVLATSLLAGLITGVYFGWHHWARPIVSQTQFLLLPENVAVTAPPPWIRADIKSEVFRDASLAEASMLEKDLAVRLGNAFEMHPWVAKVHRVSKQSPTEMSISLEYRRPIAWVKVPATMFPDIGADGVLPIDRDSVLLPQSDFTSADLDSLLLIEIQDVSLCGPIGTPWGDTRVAGGALLAELLSQHWRQLGLAAIRAVPDYGHGGPGPRPRYELMTRAGKRLIWGSPPGAETTGEPTAAQKLDVLANYIRRHGPLDASDILGLDLRDVSGLRTANLPGR